jgi:hypothetical protein
MLESIPFHVTLSAMLVFFKFMSLGWHYVSELRPPTGLFIPQIYECGEPRWNVIDGVNPKNSWDKPVPVSFCPPQIPHGLTRVRTRASTVRGRRLTPWVKVSRAMFVLLRGLQSFLSVCRIGFGKCWWSAGFKRSGLQLTWYAVFMTLIHARCTIYVIGTRFSSKFGQYRSTWFKSWPIMRCSELPGRRNLF